MTDCDARFRGGEYFGREVHEGFSCEPQAGQENILRGCCLLATFPAMNAVQQILHEYVTPEGKNPFRKWLHALRDVGGRAKIRVRLNRVRLGNFGDAKAVGGGVSELRIPYGPGYRVYFARAGSTVVLLLCGGDKSSQGRDIETAKAYWQDYQRRS